MIHVKNKLDNFKEVAQTQIIKYSDTKSSQDVYKTPPILVLINTQVQEICITIFQATHLHI